MKKVVRIFSFLAFICLTCSNISLAAIPIMPVSELQEGMRGIGKTVVKGTEIEEFSVEILGVLKNQGPVKNLILVRVSGPVIDQTGGIAQGMSGSPVLIDDKLVGAVAYGWGFSDARLGLLTPAEDMIKLWDMPHEPFAKREVIDISGWRDIVTPLDVEKDRWNEIQRGVDLQKKKETEEENSSEEASEISGKNETNSQSSSLPEVQLPEEGIRPLATPLFVNGLTPKAKELLKEKMAPFNLVPYDAGGGSDDFSGTIEPGSAIGAQLVRGDISMGALGTTTWVDEERVIAFGHPFVHDGQSSYFMTAAKVVGVIPSVNSAFKLGIIGNTVGRIEQDRTAGIGGRLNQIPQFTAVRLTINDATEKRTESLHFEVIQDEKIAPILIPVSVYSGIDQVMDRSSGGTVFVQTRVAGKEIPSGEFRRSEMFYGAKDVAEIAVLELDFVMKLLAQNPFEKVQIDEIEIQVSLISERKVAQILRAGTSTKEVYPGDTIEIEVELQPYREPRRIEKINYTIPPYASEGEWLLWVRGGATQQIPEDFPVEAIYQIWYLQKAKWLAPKDLNDLINTYLRLDHSQELIVEGYFIPSEKDKKDAQKAQKSPNPEEGKLSPLEENSLGNTDNISAYEQSFRMKKVEPWIVFGDSQIYLKVKKGKM